MTGAGRLHHTSVFPAVSPGRAREVDAAGGVCLESPRGAPAGNRRRTSGLPQYLTDTTRRTLA